MLNGDVTDPENHRPKLVLSGGGRVEVHRCVCLLVFLNGDEERKKQPSASFDTTHESIRELDHQMVLAETLTIVADFSWRSK